MQQRLVELSQYLYQHFHSNGADGTEQNIRQKSVKFQLEDDHKFYMISYSSLYKRYPSL
ncbi:hypothetical protein SUZIE_112730 [Sciurus carolinensis]|uniref:Uncharacterized protein n=1 Tax=Sciurus carolinensis TaxID=30640 RepID=A0AA41SSG7_SCICA|nr:hypothetical protein [Sciurus carolinensis]